jgi:hypothetical protein
MHIKFGRTGKMAEMVKWLPGKHKALPEFKPHTGRERRRRKRRRKRRRRRRKEEREEESCWVMVAYVYNHNYLGG